MEQEDGVYILKPPGINKHPPVSFSTLLAFYFLSVFRFDLRENNGSRKSCGKYYPKLSGDRMFLLPDV